MRLLAFRTSAGHEEKREEDQLEKRGMKMAIGKKGMKMQARKKKKKK